MRDSYLLDPSVTIVNLINSQNGTAFNPEDCVFAEPFERDPL